jgi:TonB family protein
MRDVLRDIALPPEAPRIGELSPSQTVMEKKPSEPKPTFSSEKPRPNLDSLLKKLQVPELKTVPQVQAEKPPVPTVAESQSSLTDELKRELDQELKKLAPQSSPRPAESTKDVKPPAATAKIPAVKTPDVSLQVPGLKTGASAYLTRVQQLISSNWDAPPVDVSGRVLTVTIRFRLHRDGAVNAVVVEESSGNEYYDLAGKRAVLRTGRLPPFPPDVKESYFDAHFTFVVGRPAG